MRTILVAAWLALAWIQAPETTMWGGNHVEMQIGDSGARLEFDCAHGTMDEPLRVDARGAFTAMGTFVPERSGPSRDDPPRPPKATYSGTITGDAMVLRVVVDGQDPAGTTYQLIRGRHGNVRKCR
jgi:hypothetical protein